MKASGQAAKGKQVRRLCRTVTTAAVSAALCLGPTACGGNDLLGGSEADRSSEAGMGQRSQPKPTEKSVRAFYARASKAYRDGDGHQLCRMTQRGHANAMVKQAAAAGLGVSTCPELWQF